MIESPLVLAAIIVVVPALALWLEHQVPALSKVGSALMAILFGAVLSNLGVVAPTSPVYEVVMGPVTSLAIAWLLLAVNLGDLKAAGGRMLGAFGIAVTGTALGALLASIMFASVFGDATWRLAGTLTGTYTGGSLNFVAVGRAVELPDALFAGTTAADAVTTALWLGVVILAPVWIGRFYPTPVPGTGDGDDSHRAEHPLFKKSGLSTVDLAVLLAVGFVLVGVSEWLGAYTPAIPAVLWLTTLALIVGHTAPFRAAPGAMQLGNLALHFFFVIIGIFSRIAEILVVGVEVFFFTVVMVGVQGILVYGLGRLTRMDVGTVSVASQASIGGPSSALAVAVAGKWNALVLPGIIVGLLGYAIGTYLGVGVAYVVRGLGIGL